MSPATAGGSAAGGAQAAPCPCCGRPLAEVPQPVVSVEDLTLVYGRAHVRLSRQRAHIAALLARRWRRGVAKDDLAAAAANGAQDPTVPPDDTALRVQVYRLRRDLAPLGLQIAPVQGLGYLMFDAADPPAGLDLHGNIRSGR